MIFLMWWNCVKYVTVLSEYLDTKSERTIIREVIMGYRKFILF